MVMASHGNIGIGTRHDPQPFPVEARNVETPLSCLLADDRAAREGSEHLAVVDEVKRPNKFNARKTQVHGLWFDSSAEAMAYLVLLDRQRKGEINTLERQPIFNLIVNGKIVGTYRPDFTFYENGRKIAEDTKGFRARDFGLRSRLFQALHPDIELRINGKPLKQRTAKAA
jgi:hypothetical protein